MIQKFLDALDEGEEWKFIDSFYNEMSKYDLRTILLEYMNAVDCLLQDDKDTVLETVQENLEESVCKL